MQRLSAADFHSFPGVEDWRVLDGGAYTCFPTTDYTQGARFFAAVARAADDAGHHPDVDIRYAHVTVGLRTHAAGGLTTRDVDLARAISAIAREMGLRPKPAAVESVSIGIDALDIDKVRPFWTAVLGYRPAEHGDLVDPQSRGPMVWFQQMDEPRPQRSRMHIDVAVPHDQAGARVAAAIAAGGTLLTNEHAPSWWVLADPEGNEACVCTWQDRPES